MLKRNLANFLTLLNLLFGLLSLVWLFDGKWDWAFYAFLAGIFFDYIDGFVARITGTSSEIGLQLDSLADMVTSGVVPGILVFLYGRDHGLVEPYVYGAFLISLGAAWRLAGFNIDDRQTTGFIGLPTPANALMWFGIILTALRGEGFWSRIYGNIYFLAAMIVFSVWIMNAPIRLIALKFKHFGWHENVLRYAIVIVSMLMILLGGLAFVPVSVGLYIVLSLIFENQKEIA